VLLRIPQNLLYCSAIAGQQWLAAEKDKSESIPGGVGEQFIKIVAEKIVHKGLAHY
jgi:hypothetical protein